MPARRQPASRVVIDIHGESGIAEQLDQARTNREADSRLTRACQTLKRQMRAAGVPEDEIERQHQAFLMAISAECNRIRAKWSPVLPENLRQGPTPGGAA